MVGRFAGLELTLLVNTAFMTVGLFLALLYVSRSFYSSDTSILIAILFILLQLSLLTGLALLFSCFATPLIATVATLGLYVAGLFSDDMRAFGEISQSRALESLTAALYYLLPNFSAFNIIGAVAHEKSIPAALIAYNSLYAMLYTATVLVGAVAIFSHRNLK